MTIPAKALGLTVLILAMAAGVWGMGYLWQSANPKPVVEETLAKARPQAGVIWENRQATSTLVNGLQAASSSRSFILEMKQDDLLTNPFKLAGKIKGYKGMAWQLQDSQGIVLSQGEITSDKNDGSFEVYGWYDKRPSGKKGVLMLIEMMSPRSSLYASYSVGLQTQTQTAEIYLKKKSTSSDCESVASVKRTLVSTGGDKLNYYQAALQSLLVGPTDQERKLGWQTAIPTSTKVIRVGKDDKGRYVADFSGDLTQGVTDTCQLATIKAQVIKTLTTVYLPGKSLPGRIFINGEEASF
ncbi:MAG: GerMN domain-containing protein [Patescibacteria group bacterium]